MTEIHLSFKDWSYPTKRDRIECCAWGECGFLAISSGSCVTIYSNEIGQFSPMFMWSPFEHDVVAMGWYDGSCTPTIVQPIIAIASSHGTIAVYDVRNRNVIGKVRVKGERFNCIVWNPFYRSRFYAGTQSGRFIGFQVIENSKIVTRFDLKFNYGIDFISIDPQTGTTIAIASKSGKFSVIDDVLKVDNDTPIDIITLKEKNPVVTSLSFFPGQTYFLVIATLKKSVLYSVEQHSTLPFIQCGDIKFISQLSKSNDMIIIGHSDSVDLWKFDFEHGVWNRKFVINFNKISKLPEASMYAELDHKIAIITRSHWITIVEEKREKLFISQRIRLMPAKPLDWDFRKGSIAFCTSDGNVLVTSWTPDSIIRRAQQQNTSVSSDQLNKEGSVANLNGKSLSSFYNEPAMVLNLNSSSSDNKVHFGSLPFGDNPPSSQINNSPLNSPSYTKPTFTMLMDQAGDEMEFDVNNDEFEQNNLDFSTSFVSIQASHTRNPVNMFHNNDNLSKLTQNRFSPSSPSEPPTQANRTKNDKRKNDPLSKLVEDNKGTLKLPVEVSLEKQQSFGNIFENSSNLDYSSDKDPNNLAKKITCYTSSIGSLNIDPSKVINEYSKNQISAPSNCECGNSTKLLLCFKVDNYPLNHVMWAPGGRLIVWSFYNEKNILQLVDFKRRRVISLLKVQLNAIHVPITTIFFSKDRSMFCVLIGDQTAVFMTTSAQPKQIGTLNFRHPVLGSFDPTGKKAVFVRKDGFTYIATITNESIYVVQKLKLKCLHDNKGSPTYIIWRSIGILIGTSLGYVILIDNSGHIGNQFFADPSLLVPQSTHPVTGSYHPVAKINSSVTLVSPIAEKTFLIIDDKNNAFISKDGYVECLKRNIKNIKAASHDSFLCRTAGSGKISVIAVGNVNDNGKIATSFSPLYPPCVSRCPLMLDEGKYIAQLASLKASNPQEAIQACRHFGVVFVMRLIKSKLNVGELIAQRKILFGIIESCKDFRSLTVSFALNIGDYEIARQKLLETPPNDPEYLHNMSRAALFDLNPTNSLQPTEKLGVSLVSVVQNLFASGSIREATDILLTVGGVDFLVKKYLEIGLIREAGMMLRNIGNSKEYSKIAYDVASKLISGRFLLLGLVILTEKGYQNEVIKVISGIFGDEMNHLLSFLNDLE